MSTQILYLYTFQRDWQAGTERVVKSSVRREHLDLSQVGEAAESMHGGQAKTKDLGLPSDMINATPAVQQCPPNARQSRSDMNAGTGNCVLVRQNSAKSLGVTTITRREWLIPRIEDELIRGGAVVLVSWIT